jgi:hypothetical protein
MSRIVTVRLGDTLLPVVDVTNAAFAISPSADEIAAMTAQYIKESTQSQDVSPESRAALSRSRLGSGLMAARGTFLSGLSTYLLKLGPDNLPEDFHPIDRRIAASFPSVTARLRLQDMAELVSGGVSQTLAADPNRSLHLINIAGGPSADSWNTLIKLRRGGTAFGSRILNVAVLDVDERGPAFGERVFEALRTQDTPLTGIDIHFKHYRYNWEAFDELKKILASADLKRSVCAVSSEGGLFEYGSDDDIVGNLIALREMTAQDTIIVGSACRESELTRIHAGIGVTLRPRGRDAFAELVKQAGWRVETFVERPFHDSVRLVKNGTARPASTKAAAAHRRASTIEARECGRPSPT